MARRKAKPPPPETASAAAPVERAAFDWLQPIPAGADPRTLVGVRLTGDVTHAGQPLTAGMLLAVTPALRARLVNQGVIAAEGQG